MRTREPELEEWRAFVALASALDSGAAAEALGVDPPTLGRRIRLLEQRVGYRLLVLSPEGTTLTTAGHELLPAARSALDGLAHGLTAARHAGRGEAGTLRVGFAASLAFTVLPVVLRSYRERYPDVDLDLRDLASPAQLAALRAGELDVGLLREPATEPGLHAVPIHREGLAAVLPEGHPVARRRDVAIGELAGEPFVLFPAAAGPGLHAQVLGLCHDAGFTPRIAREAAGWQTLVAFVAAGLGCTIAPTSVARLGVPGVVYRRLEPEATTTLVLCVRTGDPNPLLRPFAETVRGLVAGLPTFPKAADPG